MCSSLEMFFARTSLASQQRVLPPGAAAARASEAPCGVVVTNCAIPAAAPRVASPASGLQVRVPNCWGTCVPYHPAVPGCDRMGAQSLFLDTGVGSSRALCWPSPCSTRCGACLLQDRSERGRCRHQSCCVCGPPDYKCHEIRGNEPLPIMRPFNVKWWLINIWTADVVVVQLYLLP